MENGEIPVKPSFDTRCRKKNADKLIMSTESEGIKHAIHKPLLVK